MALTPVRCALLLAFGCTPGEAPRFRDGTPEVAAAPEDLPLTPTLRVKLDRPARLEVVVEDLRGRRAVRVDRPERRHEVPLFGSRPGDRVRLEVTASDDRGATTTELSYTVGPLPEGFPELDVLADRPELAEPGLTLLPVERMSDDLLLWLVALDGAHEVVWAWRAPFGVGDVRMQPESGLLLALGDEAAWELDPRGEVLTQWADERVPPGARDFRRTAVGVMNHEIVPVDDGFVSLVHRSTTVPRYPCSYRAPEASCGPAVIEEQRVVGWDRDGETRFDWALGERLDTFRIGYDALDRVEGGLDWSHANAVVPRPSGGWLVSSRHQDALVALDERGEVEWILGDPGGWPDRLRPLLLSPVGDLRWPYHQHGPAWAADGTLWVFDNGNEGGTPYGPAEPRSASRVVGYRVDEEALTVEQVGELWQTSTGELFSASMGNAAVMQETGNLQGTFSVVTAEGGLPLAQQGFGSRGARIVQWTRAGELAWDLRVRSDADEVPQGWRVYRSTHLDSLYPRGTEAWEDK